MNRFICCTAGIIIVSLLLMLCETSNPSGPVQSDSVFDTLSVHISGSPGYVQFNPPASHAFSIGNADSVDSAYVFSHGLNVTAIAKPSANCRFESWGGDVSGANDTISLSINGKQTLIATFSEDVSYEFTFVGSWSVSGWSWTSSTGDFHYTPADDNCHLDIRSDGTYDGWIINGDTVEKSTGTWTADKWYIYFSTTAGRYEKIIWESKSATSLSLIQATEAGQIHEMCSR